MNKLKKMMSVALTTTVLLSGMGAALPQTDAAVLIGGYPDKPHLLHFKTDVSLEVLYDARRIQFDVPPKMVEGSVLVPIRFVAEKMGGKLKLNGKDITITKGDKVLKLTRDSKKASFNGKAVTLVQPAMVDRGRTLVPLRAVSEGLGVNVEWDQPNQYVWIGSKDAPQIEDVIKPVDAKSYMKYYPKDDPVLTIYEVNSERFGKQKNTVRFIKTTDFPLAFGNATVYRMDKSKGSDGKDFIRFSSNNRGPMTSGLFIPYNEQFKFIRAYTKEVLTQATLEYVPVDYYDDDVITKLKDVNYIGINLGTDSLLLMKNEWR